MPELINRIHTQGHGHDGLHDPGLVVATNLGENGVFVVKDEKDPFWAMQLFMSGPVIRHIVKASTTGRDIDYERLAQELDERLPAVEAEDAPNCFLAPPGITVRRFEPTKVIEVNKEEKYIALAAMKHKAHGPVVIRETA